MIFFSHMNFSSSGTQSSKYSGFCATGWRRLIGSPKLQIIFHKRATKYRSLLRKMTYKDKGSYESSPPCSLLCDGMGVSSRHSGIHQAASSHKRATKYKSLLRKMTYTDKGSYESSPPCSLFCDGYGCLL